MNEDVAETPEEKLAKKRGAEIRRARQAMHMSQAELAAASGISQQTIDRIERGAVLHSRSYPKLRKHLNLDLLNYDTWPYEEGEDPAAPKGSLMQTLREGKAVEKVYQGMIPVVSNRGGTLHLADAVPKVFPVEYAEGVSAYLMTSTEMEPVVKVGDVLVVNPNIQPRVGDEVAFARDNIVFIRTYIREEEDRWVVKSWNPEKEDYVPKHGSLEHPDVIVAKYNRNR